MDAFSKRLKGLRADRGLKQTEVAAVIDVKRTYISMLENGKAVDGFTLGHLRSLAAFFGISVGDLLGDAELKGAGELMEKYNRMTPTNREQFLKIADALSPSASSNVADVADVAGGAEKELQDILNADALFHGGALAKLLADALRNGAAADVDSESEHVQSTLDLAYAS